jgi:hypothetical protein
MGRGNSPGWGRWLGVAGLLLLLAGICPDGWGAPLKRGTEVFAVDPARVLEVSYRAAAVRLMAQRWEMGQPFTLIFLEKNRAGPVFCPAGPGFEAVLGQLTSLKVKKTLTHRQAEGFLQRQPLAGWAAVEIRDNSELPPFRARITPLAGSSTEALVHFRGATYIVEFKARIFKLLGGGCAALGVRAAP